jgi:hypothetical protein
VSEAEIRRHVVVYETDAAAVALLARRLTSRLELFWAPDGLTVRLWI